LESGNHVLVLDAHNTTTPVSAELLVVVELFTEVSRKSLQVLEVLFVYFSESNSGSGLQVDELTEVGLATDEAVRNILSSAEGGKVDDSLNWIDVVSDHNKLGLVLLNKSSNVVKTELDVNGLGGLASTTGLCGLLKAKLLLLLGLWLVLSEELKKFSSLVLVNGLRELVDGGWNLEALEKNALLSLNTDVLGPFDKTGEVADWLDVTTDSEVLGGLLEE